MQIPDFRQVTLNNKEGGATSRVRNDAILVTLSLDTTPNVLIEDDESDSTVSINILLQDGGSPCCRAMILVRKDPVPVTWSRDTTPCLSRMLIVTTMELTIMVSMTSNLVFSVTKLVLTKMASFNLVGFVTKVAVTKMVSMEANLVGCVTNVVPSKMVTMSTNLVYFVSKMVSTTSMQPRSSPCCRATTLVHRDNVSLTWSRNTAQCFYRECF
jgi:hypothetical protein